MNIYICLCEEINFCRNEIAKLYDKYVIHFKTEQKPYKMFSKVATSFYIYIIISSPHSAVFIITIKENV
jgi:hypothetical protein